MSKYYCNKIQVPHTDYAADIAHEYDYESEDLDFQAETFESQHFRKKGPYYIWLIMGTLPVWFVFNEMILQAWPDEDNWRYQRPPAFQYQDDDDTPDLETLSLFKSPQYRQLWEAGILVDPFFTMKDGEKVYSKWAGVNKPMPVI